MFLLLACSFSTAALNTTQVATVPMVTAITTAPDGGLYVTEQKGRVWRIDGEATTVLDIADRLEAGGEKGLLGLAFAPDYPADPRMFVNYTYRDAQKKLWTRVASYRVVEGKGDPASEVEILTFEQPWQNHNAGALAFGPDRMLYVAVGDGGSGGDPKATGQRRDDWLGSILRIDVSVAPYQVPADNPFVGQADVKPEIWAYGVRNPWGMHFDGATLWFADVGQDDWEEVNRGVAGGNYGWNIREGKHCYEALMCESSGFVEPIAEYSHSDGRSVTGGVVYRGPSIPALDGRYIYGDFTNGKIWSVATDGGAPTLYASSELMISAFGQDKQGRLYIADYRAGVLRVDP